MNASRGGITQSACCHSKDRVQKQDNLFVVFIVLLGCSVSDPVCFLFYWAFSVGFLFLFPLTDQNLSLCFDVSCFSHIAPTGLFSRLFLFLSPAAVLLLSSPLCVTGTRRPSVTEPLALVCQTQKVPSKAETWQVSFYLPIFSAAQLKLQCDVSKKKSKGPKYPERVLEIYYRPYF